MLLRLPVMNPAAAYPNLAALQAALRTGDWPGCVRILDAAEPVERTMLIRSASQVPAVASMLSQVVAANPDDSTAAAMFGDHLVKEGWRIRTDARAEHVNRRQFEVFHHMLRQAEQVLHMATARRPEDPALWVIRLTVARGLELGQYEARRRYDQLATIDPHHGPGQMQLLQQLYPKWGGSWDAVWAFVREVTDSAPLGSHNHVLVLEPYLELAAGDVLRGGRRAMSKPEVRSAVREAADRSVFHPDFRRTHGWVQVMNTFAMAFSLGGDLRSAKKMFAALGDFGTEHPWDLLDDQPASTIWLHRLRTAFVRSA